MTTRMLPVASSLADALRVSDSRPEGGCEILTLNPEMFALMRDALARGEEGVGFEQFSAVTIDSAWLSVLLRGKGLAVGRYSGVDLVSDLLRTHAHDKRFLLYGAKPGVAERVAQRFGLTQYRAYDGYAHKTRDVAAACREQGFVPDVCFVALGQLLQFRATRELADTLRPRLVTACGGAFDVLSGDLPRAPAFFRVTGLEWAFRIALQPKRAGRMLVGGRGLQLAARSIRVRDGRHIELG